MNKSNKFKLAVLGLVAAAMPALGLAKVVGYYEMCDGQGNANQASVITAAGQTAVNVLVPNASTLGGLDVLFVTNCDNDGYGAEYMSNLPAIAAAVQNQGLTLIIHDRHVSGANTILPGVTGVSDFNDDAAIDFPAGSPILTGPGGTLTNASLDGGNSSSHGFVATATMPSGSQVLAHRTSATAAVTFKYKWGAGQVIYSTIPLDFYLGGSSAFRSPYAVNVVAYAAGLGFTSCAAERFVGAQLTLCRQVCEVSQSTATLNALITAYRTLYRKTPPCGL